MIFELKQDGTFAFDGGTISWRLLQNGVDGTTEEICPEKMRQFHYNKQSGELRWIADDGLVISLTSDRNRSSFRFSFSDCPKEKVIREIHFPIFEIKNPNGKVLLPESTGYLTGCMKDIEGEINYRRSFYPFQMTAYFGEKTNLLAMFPDPKHYCKNLLFTKKGEEAVLYVKFFMPLRKRHMKNFIMPYPCEFREFTGEWFNAAEIYREWARKQTFFLRARRRKNPLRNNAMWFWNRGGADPVSEPVMEFARRSGLPVALDWYWWHHNPYDTDYPFFWPPREGEKVFCDKISELKKAGVFTQVYTNGMTWDMDGPDWTPGGPESSIVTDKGEFQNCAFNKYNHHRLAYVCGEAPLFHEEMIRQANHLASAGVNGMYLDMIGCVSNQIPCHNPRHKHPKSGGHYHYDGYRKFLKKLKKASPSLSLSTEDCTEEYLDLFDSMILLCGSAERCGWDTLHGEFIPMFQAIYHGCTALFGNFALPDGIPPWDPLWPEEKCWPASAEKEWENFIQSSSFWKLPAM